MLAQADSQIQQGHYPEAERLLGSITMILAFKTKEGFLDFSIDPLAADYYELVLRALDDGFRPVRIRVEDETARIWVSISGSGLIELVYVRSQNQWVARTTLASD